VPDQKRPSKFRVVIEVITKSRVEKEIEAASANEARAKALHAEEKEPVEVTNAAVTRRVISVKRRFG